MFLGWSGRGRRVDLFLTTIGGFALVSYEADHAQDGIKAVSY